MLPWTWAAGALASHLHTGATEGTTLREACVLTLHAAGPLCPDLQAGRELPVHTCTSPSAGTPVVVALIDPDKLCIVHLQSDEQRRRLHLLLTARAQGRRRP